MYDDVVTLLSEGEKRTVTNVEAVVERALEDNRLIATIVNCLDAPDEVLAMHSADALQKLHTMRPDLVDPYARQLFDVLRRQPLKEVQWHLAQLLPHLKLTNRQLEEAASIWTDHFYNSKSSIVRTFSLQAIHDVLDRLPRFEPRYREMLQFALRNGTPAMRTRAKQLTQAGADE